MTRTADDRRSSGAAAAEERTSQGSSASAVELRQVAKSYGGSVALHALDLQVADGEFLSLLGPSGCGKTTTLKLIGGFEQPTSGTVLIGGVEAQTLPPYKRDVNTVFQNYALFPHMSVLDNVAYGLKQRRVDRADRRRQAMEALEMVGLGHRAAARPPMLSGGQQQRVALARALVLRPRVLLLDEPLGALDLKLREQLQIELKRIHHEVGITFVFVTHDQGEAMTMSDRIAVMNAGRIEQLATPQEVYDRPATGFVAGFIGEMNVLQGVGDGESVIVPGVFTARIGHTVESVPAGRPARVGVRTQDFAVEAGAADANATLTDVMTIGHQSRLIVTFTDGQTATVIQDRYTDSAPDAYRPGDRLRVVPVDASVLLLGAAESSTDAKDSR